MDESVVRNFEEQRVDVKPSQWMRLGIPLVQEHRRCYLVDPTGRGREFVDYAVGDYLQFHPADGTGRPCGCALGSAVYAMSGVRYAFTLEYCARILGLPEDVARQISTMHLNGMSRERCADELAKGGF